MGNAKKSVGFELGLDSRLDCAIRLDIDRRSSLCIRPEQGSASASCKFKAPRGQRLTIEDNDPRVADDDPGERDELLLARTQVVALIVDHRIETELFEQGLNLGRGIVGRDEVAPPEG